MREESRDFSEVICVRFDGVLVDDAVSMRWDREVVDECTT